MRPTTTTILKNFDYIKFLDTQSGINNSFVKHKKDTLEKILKKLNSIVSEFENLEIEKEFHASNVNEIASNEKIEFEFQQQFKEYSDILNNLENLQDDWDELGSKRPNADSIRMLKGINGDLIEIIRKHNHSKLPNLWINKLGTIFLEFFNGSKKVTIGIFNDQLGILMIDIENKKNQVIKKDNILIRDIASSLIWLNE